MKEKGRLTTTLDWEKKRGGKKVKKVVDFKRKY